VIASTVVFVSGYLHKTQFSATCQRRWFHAELLLSATHSTQETMATTEKQCCIVKRINFFGRSVKIVMQNENGPCPLLAIANVLSLRNELKLPAGIREITQVCT
jgi:hypothetical protein